MPEAYGPPPDAKQVVIAAGLADAPVAWLLSVLLGVACLLLGRRWAPATAAGLVILLTCPAVGMLPHAVWGDWPTIDKTGSLHFYSLGAHFRFWDTTAESTQLIGVSMGHLWVTALFDLVLSPFAAMNAQALMNLVLGLVVGSRVMVAAGVEERWALPAAFPFGLGLHLFRDIEWYTVEKSGTWALALYVLCLVRAHRDGGRWVWLAGIAYLWAFFYNSYWGVLGALVGGAALGVGNGNARRAVGASVLGALPLVALQLPALRNAQLPPPDAFATRAALDVLSLWPPAWNRMELWRALDPVVTLAALWAVGLALAALTRGGTEARSARFTLILAGGLSAVLILALGPVTPLWQGFSSLPGMWRFAKPETFGHLAVLGAGVLAGTALPRTGLPPQGVLAAQVALWFVLVRLHPVYPAWSAPP